MWDNFIFTKYFRNTTDKHKESDIGEQDTLHWLFYEAKSKWYLQL